MATNAHKLWAASAVENASKFSKNSNAVDDKCAFNIEYRLFPVSAKWQGMTPTKDYAEAFRKTWSKSDEIFSWLENDVLHSKTIDLRLPFVFYLGYLPFI